MEDTTSFRPVTASVCGLQEAVTFLEQKVISNQLVLHVLGHAVQSVVGALQFGISLQSVEDLLHFAFHFQVVCFSQARAENVEIL